MAEIYRVEDPENPSKIYALKLIRPDLAHEPDFREMLLDEARIAQQLRHRNIARVLELIEYKNELGLLLEHVDGVDLIRVQQILRDRKKELSLEAALLVLIDTLEGLHYAHDLSDDQGEKINIVHRDVSPGNIMVETSGQIRIVDWELPAAKKEKLKQRRGRSKVSSAIWHLSKSWESRRYEGQTYIQLQRLSGSFSQVNVSMVISNSHS